VKDLIKIAENADKKDLKYIEEGIEMNLKASEEGMKHKGFAQQIANMVKTGIVKDDFFSQVKIAVSSASDGRMAGMSLPVMSSGGSGNQGVVAILVPYLFGKEYGIAHEKILKSIALSHLLNAYVKAFAGELSPICQCAIAAGVGATAACVYQRKNDIKLIGYAINNIANDLGGMFCNGANLGCAIKVASSAEAAIISALTALNGFCISGPNGIIGKTPEETLQNLASITCEGMGKTNEVILGIMKRQNEV
jgi:L-cysteine desulfidase